MLLQQVNIYGKAQGEESTEEQGRKKAHILCPPLTDQQVVPQSFVQRFACVDQKIVDAGSLGLIFDGSNVRIDLLAILRFQILGSDLDLILSLHIDHQHRILHSGPNLLRIEDMKQNEL